LVADRALLLFQHPDSHCCCCQGAANVTKTGWLHVAKQVGGRPCCNWRVCPGACSVACRCGCSCRTPSGTAAVRSWHAQGGCGGAIGCGLLLKPCTCPADAGSCDCMGGAQYVQVLATGLQLVCWCGLLDGLLVHMYIQRVLLSVWVGGMCCCIRAARVVG
jgi:hypothetical protein